MTELFKDQDLEVKVVEGDDGSIKIGETFYKDKEAAFKGKAEADKHIAITHAENKELRDELKTLKENQGTALQKLLEKVDAQQNKQDKDDRGDDYNDSYREKVSDTVQIDQTEVKRLVQEQVRDNLSEYDQERHKAEDAERTTRNLNQIREELVKKCGSVEEAKIAWEKHISDSKFNREIYDLQVSQAPEALIKAIVPEAPVSFGQANLSSSRMPGSDGKTYSPRTWSYWSKMMMENERKYYSVENQRQMKADLANLGNARFFDK